MLEERKWGVLKALVEEHIRTAEPVSSRAILETSGLNVSSATIRNDLVYLESEGLVHQPHTSAGRIPTDKGFRCYVDNADPGKLRTQTRHRIQSFFESFHSELRSLLKETSDLLADVTHLPALVTGPGLAGEEVHSLHLVRLSDQVLMLVLVTEAGRVTQELVRLERPASVDQIDAAERLLSDRVVGTSVGEGRDSEDSTAGELGQLLQSLEVAARRAEGESRELYVGGQAQLASLWEDLGKVQAILALLEREAALMQLMESLGEGSGVLIGEEAGLPDTDVALISSGYGGGALSGRVAVLGPTRINYRRAIKIVEEVGDGLSSSLGS